MNINIDNTTALKLLELGDMIIDANIRIVTIENLLIAKGIVTQSDIDATFLYTANTPEFKKLSDFSKAEIKKRTEVEKNSSDLYNALKSGNMDLLKSVSKKMGIV